MLSYRHAFHAGNHADVFKHAVLIHCIRHFLKKEKAFHYIDTHAGAGLYELTQGFAARTRESETGIAQLLSTTSDDLPPLLKNYVDIVLNFNPTPQLEFYPGSPLIAQFLMRPHDSLRLHELHLADHDILQTHVAGDPRVLLQKRDGFRGLIKAFPPASRRGLALIDPPYEVKTDYRIVADAIHDARVKFPTGTILVWYPLLENELFRYLKEDLIQVSGPSWLNAEFRVREPGPGLYGSGLWVIQPPWDLPSELEQCQAPLLKRLGASPSASLDLRFEIP